MVKATAILRAHTHLLNDIIAAKLNILHDVSIGICMDIASEATVDLISTPELIYLCFELPSFPRSSQESYRFCYNRDGIGHCINKFNAATGAWHLWIP